jgi:hypothetical protein
MMHSKKYRELQVHCKFLPHENHWDLELRGPCRENLHYLWTRAVRIAGKPHDNYRYSSLFYVETCLRPHLFETSPLNQA